MYKKLNTSTTVVSEYFAHETDFRFLVTNQRGKDIWEATQTLVRDHKRSKTWKADSDE
jgi:hypothetical protein